MNVLGYTGFIVFAVIIAYGVKWLNPSALAHLSRKTGLTGRKAWVVTIVTFLWIFVPVLAGAETGDDELWVIGAAIGGIGFFLATIAVSSLDEYRLLQNVPHYPPGKLPAGSSEGAVATSGTPSPMTSDTVDDGQFETPFTGEPSVHTDWIVQRRTQLGGRNTWRNIAEGVQSTEFTVGGNSVTVTPGRHRVFMNTENRFVIEPDTDIPEPATTFLTKHPELPSPESQENALRIVESYIPADEPVTVVGEVEQAETPRTVRIDEAPIDELLGTHTAQASSANGGAEAILIRGNVDEARTTMKKRVYWLGILGTGMIVGGQIVSFWLSSATISTVL